MYIIIISGLLQALWLLISFFRKNKNDPMTRRVTNLSIVGFILFFISSLFSLTVPLSHAAVLFFPLASAMIFYAANGLDRYRTISIYKNREAVVKALEQNDYRLVGKRRYEQ
jgi:hypothetical protein